MAKHQAFDVYLREKLIDTVFYGPNVKIDVEEVRNSLINHDGYNPAIIVIRVK